MSVNSVTEQQGQLFLCTSCSHTSSYQTSCHEYRASLWGRVWVFPKFSSFLFRLSFLPSFFLPSLSCVIGTIIIYLQLVIAGISSRVTSSFQSICLDIVVSRRLYTQCMHFCFLCSYCAYKSFPEYMFVQVLCVVSSEERNFVWSPCTGDKDSSELACGCR